ncbi:hypothetical protein ACOMHN_032973 [Nucella lapillus]
MVSAYVSLQLPAGLKENGEELAVDFLVAGSIRGSSIQGLALITTASAGFLGGAGGLYHFDGYRIAHAQNHDCFD